MKYTLPIKLLKLEDGYHILVNININDKPARVLIDTGASHTVFDKVSIKKYLKEETMVSHDKLSTGLGTNKMESLILVVDNIDIGKLHLQKYKSIIINLSHVNEAYRQIKQKPIVGVLGSDIFKKYNAIIDYGKKRLVLQK